MAKKKRREIEEETNNGAQNDVSIANGDFESHEKHPKEKKKHREKEKARKKDTVSLQKEMSTVSIAVPGSIINNAQSFELATRVLSICLIPVKNVFLFKKWKGSGLYILAYCLLIGLYVKKCGTLNQLMQGYWLFCCSRKLNASFFLEKRSPVCEVLDNWTM